MVDLHPTECNLCGGHVDFVDNSEIYGRSFGSGKAYLCRQCGAYVGTHKPRPKDALGLLADARMRKGKMCCHEIFDKFWRTKDQRRKAYQRLADAMGIKFEDCHFGHFNLDQLRQAYRIVKSWGKNENFRTDRKARRTQGSARRP